MPNVAISSFTVPANTVGVGLSGYSLTGSNAQSMFDLSGTWNTSGTPTALKLNITDTASNANSLLMDLQVGGGSRFYVRKDGLIGNTIALGSLWINRSGTNAIVLYGAGTGNAWGVEVFSSSSVNINSTIPLGWSTALYSTPDLQLWRDAANTLAQRNGANAQTFRLYNTITDASNYERGKIAWSSNVLQIGTEKAGTGTARAVNLQTDGITRVTLGASGGITLADANDVAVGSTTGTKIGTATTQKLGFWNATPIVQPTTAVAAATVAATGAGDVVAASTTFDGYTIPQIVKALRNAGLLA